MNRRDGPAAGPVFGGSLTAGWLIVISHRPWRIAGDEPEGRYDEAAVVIYSMPRLAERCRRSTSMSTQTQFPCPP